MPYLNRMECVSFTIRFADDPPPPAEGGEGVRAAEYAAGAKANKKAYPQSAFG